MMPTKSAARKAAIARSLHELDVLFGRRKPPDQENAASGKCGAGDTQSELQKQHSTALNDAQGGDHEQP
jgi:hypothetical protein